MSTRSPQLHLRTTEEILYLFSKAHAVSYVSDEIRVAWYKVHEPEAFYRTMFRFCRQPVRKGDFQMSCQELRRKIIQIRGKSAPAEAETDDLFVYELMLEMRARGLNYEESIN